MAIVLPKSMFFHIPKTGGTWVTHALRGGANVQREFVPLFDHWFNLQAEHVTPDDTLDEIKGGKLLFTFVRNPATWYQSQWAFKDRNAFSNKDHILSKECASDDFNEFVTNCLDRFPEGMLSKVYKEFLGENLDKMDFIGRQESLREDLITVLELAEEEFNKTFIKGLGVVNVVGKGPEYRGRTKYKKDVLKRLIKVENWAFRRFGYEGGDIDAN